VIPELRKAIIYQKHDLLSLVPIRKELGLIVCKNVLLHLAPEERVAVITMFHAALAPDGYLVTEQTQKLPPETEPLFHQVAADGQVFRKAMGAEAHVQEQHRTSPRPPAPATDVLIEVDAAFMKVSDYTWFNIDAGDQRVGKARVSISGMTLTIYTLSIFPEFEGNGYAQKVIEVFKNAYGVIIADSVRSQARGFWEKMSFQDIYNGNYVWTGEKIPESRFSGKNRDSRALKFSNW
jgi:hypothetical protein